MRLVTELENPCFPFDITTVYYVLLFWFMAAKKKTSTGGSSPKSKTTTATYKGKTVSFPATPTSKPTEAIVNKGQKATGLSKSSTPDRFKPKLSKNIPTSNKAVNALNTAGRFAAESVALGGAGSIVSIAGKSIAKRAGIKAFERTGGAALQAGLERLAGATGAGGKVSRTMTPFGKTLRSTAIGSKAQQGARMGNLAIGAEKQAIRAGRIAQRNAIIPKLKATQKATNVIQQGGAIAAIQQAKRDVNKSRKKK